tara:strand:- start:1352 stop:1576 length:225 start_codon:yes stop_codon:yes gene_type:complete
MNRNTNLPGIESAARTRTFGRAGAANPAYRAINRVITRLTCLCFSTFVTVLGIFFDIVFDIVLTVSIYIIIKDN